MDNLKSLSAPKKKFGFNKTIASTSKSIPSTIPRPTTLSSTPILSAPLSTPTTPTVPTTSLTLSNKKDSYLSTSDLPISINTISEALLLNDLDHCFVDLTPSGDDTDEIGYSTIYLYSLRNSVILIPSIKGSIMVHNCLNCILILGSHQVCNFMAIKLEETSSTDKSSSGSIECTLLVIVKFIYKLVVLLL